MLVPMIQPTHRAYGKGRPQVQDNRYVMNGVR